MFIFYFKYAFLSYIRQKEVSFWSLLFPIVLGTLFFAAFSNLMSFELLEESIPVAVVSNNQEITEDFIKILNEAQINNEVKMFDVKLATKEEAEALLTDKEIDGILIIDKTVSVKVGKSGTEQSIISDFASTYNQVNSLVDETMKTDPRKIEEAVNVMLNTDKNYGKVNKLTEGVMDSFGQYFYNLLAMCCLFASMASMYIPIRNQGNLSDLGARKCIAPKNKALEMIADASAILLIQYAFAVIAFLYLKVLGVDFGSKTMLILITLLVGVLAGVSFGYFVGSIGKFNAQTKSNLLSSISLMFCFLSGLMVGNMRMVVDKTIPFFNKINPAALISDAFFSLNMYSDYERYIGNIINLIVISTIFLVLGLFNTRRESYASI